LWVISL